MPANKPVVIFARSFSLPSFFFFLPPKMPRVTMPSGACGAYTCCGRSVGGGITSGFPLGPRGGDRGGCGGPPREGDAEPTL